MPSLFNRTPVEVRQKTEIDLLRRKVTALEKEISAEKKNVASYVKSEKDTLAAWRKYVENLFRGLREDYANLQESLERTEATYRNKMGSPRYEREGLESSGVGRDDNQDVNGYGAQRNEFSRDSNQGESSYGVQRNHGGQTIGAKSSQAKEEGLRGSQGSQADSGMSGQGSGKDLAKEEDQGSKDDKSNQENSWGQGDQTEKVESEAQGDQGFGNEGVEEVQADPSWGGEEKNEEQVAEPTGSAWDN
ncbi:uncharacterized protein Bfra_006072 [Botrytis fragariae]|uniref:Uncharacterized protein n=1 Tax=Botrytis fragariae TaxID=1964551 RepID=A0A8H6AS97_9HELO|nr:uncharacterized protein Bfra_006072 [Botrytis fragariae]KAF5872709.1 hypothetical protein Bfra_006072 [Botrytis fragariae]